MKIAVSSQGPTLESTVDPRFGRAKYFIVVDVETGDFEAVENVQNLNATQGAGVQSAQAVASKGVEAVLTGHCGPKAFRALSAAAIAVYTDVSGSVQDGVEQFRAGTLAPCKKPDVAGHWM